MARSSARRARAALAQRSAAAAPDWGARIALALIALTLVLTASVFDAAAEASFDAPKRLIGRLGIAAAALALLIAPGAGDEARGWRAWTTRQRVIAGLALGALALATLSSLVSPRRALSLDALRGIALLALALPLGASRALAGRGRIVLLAAFCGAGLVEAGLAALQAGGAVLYDVVAEGGRAATGALVGNEGHLAQLLALGAVALLPLVSLRRWRLVAGTAALLLAAGVVVTQNLTALAVVLAAGAVTAATVHGRRAVLAGALATLGFALALGLHPPLALRVYKAAEAAGEGRWAMVLSNRRAPWSAAWEMVRERPLVGFGPGTFGAEYLPMRLRAELRARTRFLVPGVPVSSYSETHCEYLQAAAEAGLPAAAAASLAAALLGLGLLEAARRQGACRVEALVLLSLLAAGAVSAATWFPLQKTFTALPLLIAAGRAFRLAGGAPPTEAAA